MHDKRQYIYNENTFYRFNELALDESSILQSQIVFTYAFVCVFHCLSYGILFMHAKAVYLFDQNFKIFDLSFSVSAHGHVLWFHHHLISRIDFYFHLN